MAIKKYPVFWAILVFLGALLLHKLNQDMPPVIVAEPVKPMMVPVDKVDESVLDFGKQDETRQESSRLRGAEVRPQSKTSPAELEPVQAYLLESVAQRAPSISKLRNEIRRSPHTTPTSYVNFAVEMSFVVEVALKTEKSAKAMFQYLRDCVETDPEAISGLVRMHCLRETQRMSAVRTELRADFKDLAQQLRPSDRHFLRSMGKIRVTPPTTSAG